LQRTIGAALIAAAGACAFAAPALASGPTRSPEHLPKIRISRVVCGFPVLVTPVVDRGIVKTYPDGHVLITGALKESMTNLRNGHHIMVNSSGPVRIFTAPNGTIVVQGHGTGWIAEWGLPGLNFLREVHGQTISDDNGVRLVHGTSRNLCPLLR
jgi:hypothetical protein